jgi:hypothetical protein
MSKDKRKKIARAILFQALMSERDRATKKAVKSERDAKAKREKRAGLRLAREAAAAAGVVAAPIEDGSTFYVAAPYDTSESWDAENMRYEHGRLPAAPREFVTWTRQEALQVLGQA